MTSSTIKTILVIIIFIISIIFPISETQPIKTTILTCVFSFIFGLLFAPLSLYNSLHQKLTIIRPKWSNKINTQQPLTYIQFIAISILLFGAGGLIGGLFHGQILNFIGAVLFITGLGLLIGIYLISTKYVKIYK